ncbi:hypothetical protein [Treponema sp.]|uniref:hypothetical protein n=1 Tax=Treponema sp. TaxID=166 RepID=UPI003F0512C9
MKKFKWLAVLAAIALAFAGCSDSSDDETSSALSDFSKAAVGDIVLSDGTFVKPENFTADMTAAAVIVRAKNGETPALGVGIKHKQLAWCTKDANAYEVNITGLQEDNCTDGSDGWSILKEALKTAGKDDDTADSSKYPAWNFCNTYGTVNSLTGSLATGWYLPAVEELKTIYESKDTIDASLERAGGSQFGTDWYWSCCQYSSDIAVACNLHFANGNVESNSKYHCYNSVCSVRAFN